MGNRDKLESPGWVLKKGAILIPSRSGLTQGTSTMGEVIFQHLVPRVRRSASLQTALGLSDHQSKHLGHDHTAVVALTFFMSLPRVAVAAPTAVWRLPAVQPCHGIDQDAAIYEKRTRNYLQEMRTRWMWLSDPSAPTLLPLLPLERTSSILNNPSVRISDTRARCWQPPLCSVLSGAETAAYSSSSGLWDVNSVIRLQEARKY